MEINRNQDGGSAWYGSHRFPVGVDDESIFLAINLINNRRYSAIDGVEEVIIPLPLASNIMSTGTGYEIAKQYKGIDAMAKRMGRKLNSPFMTLSFTGLLIIPTLKLSDKGLFDASHFEFTNVFCWVNRTQGFTQEVSFDIHFSTLGAV